MPIVTAMFDSRSDADAARARLESLGDVHSVSIVDQSTSGFSTSEYSTRENRGFWATLKDAFLPDEDRHTYEEGVRRGGYLLTATVPDGMADEATRILDDANSVDIEERSGQWRQSGWDYQAPAAGAATAYAGDRGMDRDMDRPMAATGEQAIPVVEEQLVVGKREVNRGTVRVRSYVTERPVSEQVSLREEHVSVERRPATGQVPADAFRERTVELTETAEEAVVGKQARVVEEVVVRKDADTRVETVTDTVRRTDVEVDRGGLAGDRTGMTGDRAYAGTDRPLVDTDGDGRGAGQEARGLGNEAIGNVKQGLGALTGSESLRQDGAAQERRGEAQQGERKY